MNNIKILKAEITNFKNIDYKQIDFDGRSIIIAGKNGLGKSSLIQAIMSPIDASYIPIEPIKQGEEKGSISLVIGGTMNGEQVKYKLGVFFSQADKRGRITIEDREGTPIKGGERGIIDGIVGNISFDIMSFIRLGEKNGKISKPGVREQIEILKELIPQETLDQLHALDLEKKKKYDQRTDLNRDIKFLDKQIKESSFTQDDIEKYSEKVTIAELSKKIEEANRSNDIYEKCQKIINDAPENKKELDEEIQKLEEQLQKRKNEREHLDKQEKKCLKWIKEHSIIDTSKLTQQLENASEHNTKHEQVKLYDETIKSLRSKEIEAENISERLVKIEEEKKSIFANAKMPVKGLEFDEEIVTFRGLPLSEGNIPSSQLIYIGLRIGMALNPNLRLLVIRDGSLLDSETMKYVLSVCEKYGYQVLIEVVKSEEGELTVEFVES